MPGRPSGDDEDDDLEDDDPVEVEAGAAAGGSGEGSTLGEAILDATLGLVRLSILLAEADAGAWKECAGRLGPLFAALDGVPRVGPKARRVGFEAPTKAPSGRRGAAPTSRSRSRR